jgi:hypothetical protein
MLHEGNFFSFDVKISGFFLYDECYQDGDEDK